MEHRKKKWKEYYSNRISVNKDSIKDALVSNFQDLRDRWLKFPEEELVQQVASTRE